MAQVAGVISVACGQQQEGRGSASRISHLMLHVVASAPLHPPLPRAARRMLMMCAHARRGKERGRGGSGKEGGGGA